MKKIFTIDDIRDLQPCYDPTKYLPEGWQGTITDILNLTECPAEDRVWVGVQLLPLNYQREVLKRSALRLSNAEAHSQALIGYHQDLTKEGVAYLLADIARWYYHVHLPGSFLEYSEGAYRKEVNAQWSDLLALAKRYEEALNHEG